MAEPLKTWSDVAEHYRIAMLDAEARLNTIPARAHPVAVLVDPVAVEISKASLTLWQARQDMIMLYHQGDLPDE